MTSLQRKYKLLFKIFRVEIFWKNFGFGLFRSRSIKIKSKKNWPYIRIQPTFFGTGIFFSISGSGTNLTGAFRGGHFFLISGSERAGSGIEKSMLAHLLSQSCQVEKLQMALLFKMASKTKKHSIKSNFQVIGLKI